MHPDLHIRRHHGPDENPEVLAKQAIRLLEKRLHEDFGVKLRMGAELEFSLSPRHKHAAGINAPAAMQFDLDHETLKHAGFTPAIGRPQTQNIRFADNNSAAPYRWVKNVSDPLFPDSPYVSYSYEEAHINKFECVISHEGRHDQLPPDGSRALTFARAIEGLRNSITSSNRTTRPLAKNTEHADALRTIAQDWRPVFDGAVSQFSRTHGLHINLSFVDGDNAPRLDLANKAMGTRIRQLMSDGAYLLLHDDTSLERERQRKHETCESNNLRQLTNDYLEVTRPAANSNAYYATMLTMLGVYSQLANPAHTPERPDAESALSRRDYARRFLREDNQVTVLLDQLEPKLGTRLRHAIERHPPGTETTREQSYIR